MYEKKIGGNRWFIWAIVFALAAASLLFGFIEYSKGQIDSEIVALFFK